MNMQILKKWLWTMEFLMVLVMFWACSDSDKTAGGTTEDAGIIADLNVAGLTQKGPFAKGSAVTVQGVDCQTMELTDEKFTGSVKSDKGDFGVEDVNLSATCALFEVTGYYFNELTGKKSSEKMTLHALTDLKDRKNVNINLLTQLEYERVMNLVTKKDKSLADAKKQAEKEVLAAFNVKAKDGEFAQFEDLNILEKGDDNAALLAVSVMVQGDESVSSLEKRMEKFAGDFAEDGQWNDSKTKKEIAEWAASATENGKLDTIRKNVESMNNGKKVPAFEKFIEAYADGSEYDTSVNTLKDLRDGKTYRTVKIGDQIWMAENLNYKIDSSFCYNDSSKFCDKYGRLYTWTAAMDACPDGWRLPGETDFKNLVKTVGGEKDAGTKLKSTSGWHESGNGTDAFGFSALPAGMGNMGIYSGEDYTTYFWGSTECSDENSSEPGCASAMYLEYDEVDVQLPDYAAKDLVLSVRCVKGEPVGASSSSALVSSSSETRDSIGFDWSLPKQSYFNPNIKYDSIVDSRDGKVYKTVKIGNQVWMAENLNYSDSVKTPSLVGRTGCYVVDDPDCKWSGRGYSWAAAIDSVALANDPENPVMCGHNRVCNFTSHVRGICPEGWHLPDTTEWNNLFAAVGGRDVAGLHLKAKMGWHSDSNGVDDYGFSAIATDFSVDVYGDRVYRHHTNFWSSVENGLTKSATAYLEAASEMASISDKSPKYAGSTLNGQRYAGYMIRCLKDE